MSNDYHEANKQLMLFKRHQDVHIYVSGQENSAVQLAAKNLIRDIGLAIGCHAVLSRELEGSTIRIGTLDQDWVREAASEAGLAIHKLLDESGSARWEAYLQQAADGVLYIIGTNRRGTIYGIYDLCEQIGVSPWYYWADVPVKARDEFSVPADYCCADWPSVAYRGIFINDEEELEAWAKQHSPDGTIGPTVYRHLFELLLRLKANYIWPAMHVNYFNENPRNNALADEMGIVIGTSHCDMLLRSNQNEWEPWLRSKGYHDAEYDYSIEGRNRKILIEYWRESVEANRHYEVSFTMGMRGIHDSGFHTRAIDEDETLTPEQKRAAKLALLAQVIRDQQQILRDVLGESGERAALKTFIPYKEVLDLYDQGLEVPEDVTLIWANDNFGHMRRYPNEAERRRPGGHGLYFHNSYWAHPGTAMSYLFLNSIPLAHTGNELWKAYESGIRKLWVLNVGGLKPLEQDMEFFLRYAWEAGREDGLTKDARRFTEHWINANFSGQHGAEAAELYEFFAQVTNVRKIEHMHNYVFSQTAYGDEAGRRLMRLEEIWQRGNHIWRSLPEEEREAFFQLFLMKIHASYFTNLEYYCADRSILAYERGNMQAADFYTDLSVKMSAYRRRMLHYYNKKMSGGKWDSILTPEEFPPPTTAMHPARKPALKIAGGGMRVDLWNEESELRFSVYGRRQKWIELGNLGVGSIPYRIEIRQGAEWLDVSTPEGTFQTEARIVITARDPVQHAGKHGLIIVHNLRDGAELPIQVQIEEQPAVPEGYRGFIEADGYVSIPAASYARTFYYGDLPVRDSDGSTDHSSDDRCAEQPVSCGWITVPGLGRYEGAAVMAWYSELASWEGDVRNAPYLEYEIFVSRSGGAMLEVFRALTLNATGRIRFAIGFDDEEPTIVESETRDEWTGNWQQAVFNNGERLLIPLLHLTAGTHRLRLYMIDRYVTISKLVICTGHARRDTNLGPATSWHDGAPAQEFGVERPEADLESIERICEEIYRTAADEVPLPDMLYAPREFFERFHQQVFIPCVSRPQVAKGKPGHSGSGWPCGGIRPSQGAKDLIATFGSGMFIEQNGILAIEAEYALEESRDAWLSESQDGRQIRWTHLQAETNARTGLAMHVAQPGLIWEDPLAAPAMHYRIQIQSSGTYRVWLLLWHYNSKSDSCWLSLDGVLQPLSEQLGRGKLHTYNTAYAYYWCLLSDLYIPAGEHQLSIIARKSELRIDRIYLTLGDELPPVDAEWVESRRADAP
jgi:hypothetical protein